MAGDQNGRRDHASEGGAVSFRAPDLLRASLLLLIHERGDYGYELHNRLVELAGISYDNGTVYRVLNHMKDEGLVTSGWERSQCGPARRRYRLSPLGGVRLDAWSKELGRLSRVLGAFEARYRQPGCEPPAPPPTEAEVDITASHGFAQDAGLRGRRAKAAEVTGGA